MLCVHRAGGGIKLRSCDKRMFEMPEVIILKHVCMCCVKACAVCVMFVILRRACVRARVCVFFLHVQLSYTCVGMAML
jgi:hypothetical protein